MRKFFTVLILVGLTAITSAQVALSMSDTRAAGIDVQKLDQAYKSALNIEDSTKAAFAGRKEEFVKAYKQMLGDLGVYLSKNNFFWERETKFYNRIYFKADGHIDYYIYSFKANDITASKESDFKKLMNQFVKTYKFPITCKVNFAQCSPVTFLQNNEDPAAGAKPLGATAEKK